MRALGIEFPPSLKLLAARLRGIFECKEFFSIYNSLANPAQAGIALAVHFQRNQGSFIPSAMTTDCLGLPIFKFDQEVRFSRPCLC